MKDFLFGQIHVYNILNPSDLFFGGLSFKAMGQIFQNMGPQVGFQVQPPKFNIALEK